MTEKTVDISNFLKDIAIRFDDFITLFDSNNSASDLEKLAENVSMNSFV